MPYETEYKGREVTFRGAIRFMHGPLHKEFSEIDLDKLFDQFKGAEYRRLVERQVRKNHSVHSALLAPSSACDPTEKNIITELIDDFNAQAHDKTFWQRDCSDVFSEICRRFVHTMQMKGHKPDSAAIFNAFQVVTLNFAAAAINQKTMRQFIGIKRH